MYLDAIERESNHKDFKMNANAYWFCERARVHLLSIKGEFFFL